MDFAPFRPATVYWRADDGRIFSGPKQQLIQSSDTDYQAYVAAGLPVRAWLRDIEGNQTTAALQELLTPYGMFADLAAYAASVRYTKEIGGTTINGVGYPSDRDSQAKLTAAALFAQVDNTQTFQWKLSDGSFTPALTAAQMVGAAAAIGGFVNACFAKEAEVVAAINATTITTHEQVDAAFAAL